jgi:dienelactone hydrolase
MRRSIFVLLIVALASPAIGATFDEAAPPGLNYDRAEFRLWLPDAVGPIRALVILVPGSNGDGRGDVDDVFWQRFATRRQLALIGCRFTDKTHEQMFIEQYVDASKGSGDALLNAVAALAKKSGHPEIASAPLLLWGMSAGGEFNYEFTAWKPERVLAFVVNKGNVYYTALAPAAARRVPGVLFTGEKDLAFRVDAINGLFAINRRAGALWAYAQEPGVGHEIAHSREFAAVLFDEMLSRRLSETGEVRALEEKSGFYADGRLRTVQPVGETKPPASYPVSWLSSERLARAWQDVIAGRTIEDSSR